MSNSVLAAIVTGMPRSGTTLISRILMSHPQVWSGFETGILLREFENSIHATWMTHGRWHWGLKAEDLKRINRTECYETKFRLLREVAGTKQKYGPFSFMHRNFQGSPYVIDKTPQYVFEIDEVLKKTDAPVFMVYKDFPTYFRSQTSRSESIEKIKQLRRSFIDSVKVALKNRASNNQLFLFSLETYLQKFNECHRFFLTKIAVRLPEFKITPALSLIKYRNRIPNAEISQSIGEYSMASVDSYNRAPDSIVPKQCNDLLDEDLFLNDHSIKFS